MPPTVMDRQWDCRFNIGDQQQYLDTIIEKMIAHHDANKVEYLLVGGIEIGTRPQHTDYQARHVHVAVILRERMSEQALLNKWGIERDLGYYMVPRNRDLPYDGWRSHHIKEFSKVDLSKLLLLELGTLPNGKRKATQTLRSESEKKMKTDDVIRDMRLLIEEGKSEEAFEKYPRNYMMYGEKIKSMVSQKLKTFFGDFNNPHMYVHGFPGTGKTSVMKFLYPQLYKKDLSNRFFDLYNEDEHTHIMLEDLDSPTLDRLSVQWLKTICDEAGFPIDQKYKTPQLTRSTILVTSNQTINQLIDNCDENKCTEDTKKAIQRRFMQIRVDELLRLLGIKMIPEYERKQLKRENNQDFSKLFMVWNYALDSPTGEPIKDPSHYQKIVRDFYYK